MDIAAAKAKGKVKLVNGKGSLQAVTGGWMMMDRMPVEWWMDGWRIMEATGHWYSMYGVLYHTTIEEDGGTVQVP